MIRRLAAAAVLFAVAAALSCAGQRRVPQSAPPGAERGVYRARVETPDGHERRFRLLLYAEAPDRLHGEVLSAVGSTEIIVDGGDGRLAVTVVRQRISYVGAADARAMEMLLGVPLSLEQLVAGLLGRAIDSGEFTVARSPAGGPGLPDQLEIRGSQGRLALDLKRKRPLRVSTANLGTGEPPPRMERLPLEALERLELPDEGEAPVGGWS